MRAVQRKSDRLRSHAAAGFENSTSCRVRGIGVQAARPGWRPDLAGACFLWDHSREHMRYSCCSFWCWIVLILAANCGGSERALPPGCKLSDMLADITGLFHRPQSECPGKPFIATPSCRCPMRAACNARHQAGRLFFGLMAARFLRLSCFRPRGRRLSTSLRWPFLADLDPKKCQRSHA